MIKCKATPGGLPNREFFPQKYGSLSAGARPKEVLKPSHVKVPRTYPNDGEPVVSRGFQKELKFR